MIDHLTPGRHAARSSARICASLIATSLVPRTIRADGALWSAGRRCSNKGGDARAHRLLIYHATNTVRSARRRIAWVLWAWNWEIESRSLIGWSLMGNFGSISTYLCSDGKKRKRFLSFQADSCTLEYDCTHCTVRFRRKSRGTGPRIYCEYRLGTGDSRC